METIYKSEDVNPEHRSIFDQLESEFGTNYQIWSRVEDFGRWVSAGVLNPKTNIAVTITLRGKGDERTSLLSSSEIKKIKDHFDGGVQKDLEL